MSTDNTDKNRAKKVEFNLEDIEEHDSLQVSEEERPLYYGSVKDIRGAQMDYFFGTDKETEKNMTMKEMEERKKQITKFQKELLVMSTENNEQELARQSLALSTPQVHRAIHQGLQDELAAWGSDDEDSIKENDEAEDYVMVPTTPSLPSEAQIEQIQALEAKLQDSVNDNVKLQTRIDLLEQQVELLQQENEQSETMPIEATTEARNVKSIVAAIEEEGEHAARRKSIQQLEANLRSQQLPSPSGKATRALGMTEVVNGDEAQDGLSSSVEMDRLRSEIEDLKDSLAKEQSDKEASARDRDAVNDKLEELQGELDQERELSQQLRTESEALSQEKEMHESQVEDLQKQVEDIQKRRDFELTELLEQKAAQVVLEYEGKIQDFERQLREARIKNIEDEAAVASSKEESNRQVNELQQQFETRLAHIQSEYDTKILALEAQLQEEQNRNSGRTLQDDDDSQNPVEKLLQAAIAANLDEIQEIELLTAYEAKMKETVESYEEKIDQLQSTNSSTHTGNKHINELQDEITKLRSELNAAATKERDSRTQYTSRIAELESLLSKQKKEYEAMLEELEEAAIHQQMKAVSFSDDGIEGVSGNATEQSAIVIKDMQERHERQIKAAADAHGIQIEALKRQLKEAIQSKTQLEALLREAESIDGIQIEALKRQLKEAIQSKTQLEALLREAESMQSKEQETPSNSRSYAGTLVENNAARIYELESELPTQETLHAKRLSDMETALKDNRKELEEMESNFDILENENSRLKDELDKQTSVMEAALFQSETKLVSQAALLKVLTSEVESIKEEKTLQDSQILKFEMETNQLSLENQELQNKIASEESQLKRLALSNMEAESRSKEQQERIESLENEIDQLRSDAYLKEESHIMELDHLKGQLFSKEETIKEMDSEVERIKTELSLQESRTFEIEAQVLQRETTREEYQKQIKSVQSKLQDVIDVTRQKESELRDQNRLSEELYEHRLSELGEKYQHDSNILRTELADLQELFTQAQMERSRLQVSNEEIRETLSELLEKYEAQKQVILGYRASLKENHLVNRTSSLRSFDGKSLDSDGMEKAPVPPRTIAAVVMPECASDSNISAMSPHHESPPRARAQREEAQQNFEGIRWKLEELDGKVSNISADDFDFAYRKELLKVEVLTLQSVLETEYFSFFNSLRLQQSDTESNNVSDSRDRDTDSLGNELLRCKQRLQGLTDRLEELAVAHFVDDEDDESHEQQGDYLEMLK